MTYCNQFESFNPLTEYLPAAPFSYLPKIGWRARSLLSGCSFDRIEKIAKKVSAEIDNYYSDQKDNAIQSLQSKFSNGEMSQDEFERFFYWDGGTIRNGRWIFRDEMEDDLDFPRENNSSEVDALKSIFELRDAAFSNTNNIIEPSPNKYSEGKDYEFFAVMSLRFIADALEVIKHEALNSKTIAGDCLMEAMDAVSYAEHLREKAWLISYSEKNKISALQEALEKQSEQSEIWREEAIQRHKNSLQKQRSEFAKQGVAARLAKDPIQLAKAQITREYNEQKSRFKRWGYSAEFARKMIDKYPVIKSIKTIEKLVSQLNKQNDVFPR